MEFPGAAEDPETISFIDPVWLQQWGLGPENVLDYFALSTFYDKSCNNEQCRMQGVDPREGLKNLTGLEVAGYMIVMSNVVTLVSQKEVVLEDDLVIVLHQACRFMLEELPEEMSFLLPGQPAPVGPQPRRLFVIKKQIRKSRNSVEVQAIYYVMEGVIYQAPTVQKLIRSRLHKFTHHLNDAFVEVSKLAELNDSAGGYDWAWQKEAKALREAAAVAGGIGTEEDQRTSDTKAALKLSMDNILMGLVDKYIKKEGDGSRGVKRKVDTTGDKATADGTAIRGGAASLLVKP